MDFGVDDVSDELCVTPNLGDVEDFAFVGEGEFFDDGGVDVFGFDGGVCEGVEFVFVASGCEADVVGLDELVFGGDVDGERFVVFEVAVGVGGFADGDSNTGRIGTADATP